jgi:hypothetical protein
MAEGWRDWLNAWEDFRIAAVDEYRGLDDERVLVFHRFSGRGKTSGLEVEQTRTKGASLFHVRDGKVTRLISYAIREEALADLGLPPETGSPPFVVVAASSEAGVSHGAKSRSARIRFTPVGREQTVFPQDAVTIDGETRDYVGRFFCPRCGSSVSHAAQTKSK